MSRCKVLFWGSGKDGYERNRRKLTKITRKAISIASGLQQPDHSDSDEAAKRAKRDRKLAEKRLRQVLRDFRACFIEE